MYERFEFYHALDVATTMITAHACSMTVCQAIEARNANKHAINQRFDLDPAYGGLCMRLSTFNPDGA
ncbi:unnamed protein product [Schistocephalus solidus]|uniref:Transposase n=1 Tax=Schistocephalus solidus TaxID=70667 RepID=A0A183TDU3_SCHSO|nr:unnamed protein product [Schistocephalus solidus]